jgi:hypothetical protein
VKRRRTMRRNQRNRGTVARRSPKRNNAPRATRPASPTLADLQEQVSALTRELAEAREQQTATSEVLQVISSSLGELGPVFSTMIETATRLCGADVGTLALYEGGGLRGVAVYGHSERNADVISRVNRSVPGIGLAEMEETRHNGPSGRCRRRAGIR